MKVIFHFFQHNYVYLNEKSHSNVFCEIAWTNFSYGIEKEQSTHMQYIIKYYFLRNIFLIILYHSKNVISFDNCITWQLNYLILNMFYEFFFSLLSWWKSHNFKIYICDNVFDHHNVFAPDYYKLFYPRLFYINFAYSTLGFFYIILCYFILSYCKLFYFRLVSDILS